MRYLLDINIVSDLVRNPQGRVAQYIRKIGEARVRTSIIVAAELRYGAAKKQSQRLSSHLQAVLGALEVLPFETPADTTYGRLRVQLEQDGKPIGANDLLIAAQAMPWVIPSSPPTKASSRESRGFVARIGCARTEISSWVCGKRIGVLSRSNGSELHVRLMHIAPLPIAGLERLHDRMSGFPEMLVGVTAG